MSGFKDFNLNPLQPHTKTLSSSLEEEDWETHDEPVAAGTSLPQPKPLAPKNPAYIPTPGLVGVPVVNNAAKPPAHATEQQQEWLKPHGSMSSLKSTQPTLAKSNSQGFKSSQPNLGSQPSLVKSASQNLKEYQAATRSQTLKASGLGKNWLM